MTPKTPQCEVFCPFNSSSEFSGVPKDSKFPFLGVWASPSYLAQSGVAIVFVKIPLSKKSTMEAIVGFYSFCNAIKHHVLN
jgi:hypothetical protein